VQEFPPLPREKGRDRRKKLHICSFFQIVEAIDKKSLQICRNSLKRGFDCNLGAVGMQADPGGRQPEDWRSLLEGAGILVAGNRNQLEAAAINYESGES
jgi:hypothetical protein